ncbi:MAG: hypothetical protein L6R48_01825 [Planctomycetes bacterium]|nr:hypothetical protein [Planctomycetota bacterium]
MNPDPAVRHPHEAHPGPDQLPACDLAGLDRRRRRVHGSYERFLRERLRQLDAGRAGRWRRDYASPAAYLASVAPMRRLLQESLGFWTDPAQRPAWAALERETVYRDGDGLVERLWYEAVPGVETYCLLATPAGGGHGAGLVVQHGYGGTPEGSYGLVAGANGEDYSSRSLGLRAMRRGYRVVLPCHPTGYGRAEAMVTSLPGETWMTHHAKNRLHRLAVMGGGTLFGLDMMASSRAVDLLLAEGATPGRIGMYGLSQGGQSALFLPALDLRVRASVASAYVNRRLDKLIGPHRARCYLESMEEDKFLPNIVSHFQDADLISLTAPRWFAVEAGEQDTSVDFERAEREVAEARGHYRRLGIPERLAWIPHAGGHVSATAAAFDFLAAALAAD